MRLLADPAPQLAADSGTPMTLPGQCSASAEE